MNDSDIQTSAPPLVTAYKLPDGRGGFDFCPYLMTEDELIGFLRIPEISRAQDLHNVIEHLKRYRGLPRFHICNKVLHPLPAILKWIDEETRYDK